MLRIHRIGHNRQVENMKNYDHKNGFQSLSETPAALKKVNGCWFFKSKNKKKQQARPPDKSYPELFDLYNSSEIQSLQPF